MPIRVPRPRPRTWLRRAATAALVLGVLASAAFAVLLVATPSVTDAESRVHAQAAVNGVVDTGSPVPATFAAALVATEDSRFYSHHGVDLRGAARAVVGALTAQDASGGATLDQQLAKLLYFGGQRNPTDQVQEVTLAFKLDTTYSKAEILQMYAQTAYFGHGGYGLDAASCRYFGVPPARLGWGQASLLAGLVQAPSAYDPYLHPRLARARQGHVLERLTAIGALTPAQASEAAGAPWGLLETGGHPAPGC